MSVLRKQGEKIFSDFIEDDFISALETGLNRTFYYQDKNIEISRISQSDENELGYDGVLTTIVPFYIQFKRADFYTPNFSGQMFTDRQHIGFPIDKGFFAFELLKKNGLYEQHNTMFQLSQRVKAAYVAPLFFKKKDLSKMKDYHREFIPAYFDDIIIHDFNLRRRHNYRNLLLFKNSITIPPHAEIIDNEPSHHYSYCRGNNVGFHSEPVNLSNSNTVTLYTFIQNIFKQDENSDIESQTENTFRLMPALFGLENNSQEYHTILNLSIKRVSNRDEITELKSSLDILTTIDKLLIIEDLLFQYFNIRQFIKYEKLWT